MSPLAKTIQDPKNVDVVLPYRLGHEMETLRIKGFIEKISRNLRTGEVLIEAANDIPQVNAVYLFKKMAPPIATKVLPPVAWRWDPNFMPRGAQLAPFEFFVTHCTAMACFHFTRYKAATPEFQSEKERLNGCWRSVYNSIHEFDARKISHVAYRVICIAEDQDELTPQQTEDLKYILTMKPERLPTTRAFLPKIMVYSLLSFMVASIVAYSLFKFRGLAIKISFNP